MADAAVGHNSVLSLRCTIWLGLFMDHDHMMWIGRLSSAIWGNNISSNCIFCMFVYVICCLFALVSLIGWTHSTRFAGRNGWFPSTTGNAGSWSESTAEWLWHPGASFHRCVFFSWLCLLACICSAQCVCNVMLHVICIIFLPQVYSLEKGVFTCTQWSSFTL